MGKIVYIQPKTSVKQIETEMPLAESPRTSGNTGITPGSGETPGSVPAKRMDIFSDENENE